MITKLLLIISACMATSGCLTQKLFDDTRLYTEVVDAAFISPDSKKVAVLGSEYDYVFADVEDLSAIIKSEVHDDLHADMSSFTVGADNSVYGGIVLSMPRGNSDAEDLAESLGFMKDGNAHLRKTIQISGVRYRKNSELKLLESYKLNNTYEIRVREPANRSSSRLLLTPITIAADGVVLLFAIPVVTFLLHREANPGGS